MPSTVKELLDLATIQLQNISERARQEAKILLAFQLNCDILWLMTHEADEIKVSQAYFDLVNRRVHGEPIEYITNSVSFYSETFYAAPGALIARPETEILVDKVLETLPSDFSGHIVEVGIGSGIISIMLAKHLLEAKFSAVDISEDALAVAQVNIERFGLSQRIKLFKGDLLSPIEDKIDVLVSNPPYIEAGVLLEKPLDFEPQNALFGGTKGDEILKRLINEATLRKIPMVACEMGYDQKESINNYIKIKSCYNIAFYKDLADFDRGFVLNWREDA